MEVSKIWLFDWVYFWGEEYIHPFFSKNDHAVVILLGSCSLESFKNCKKKSVLIFTFLFYANMSTSFKTDNTFALIEEKELTSGLV